MSKRKRKPDPRQIYERKVNGKWTYSKWEAYPNGIREVCCDCGLVHDTEFKIKDGVIWMRTKSMPSLTRKERELAGRIHK
jgi:hypothetical protein